MDTALIPRIPHIFLLSALVTAGAILAACGANDGALERAGASQASDNGGVPESLPMGGARSRMTFFITSVGVGRGGNLGGLRGADAHCQALATAEGAGDHTWHAYLSTMASGGAPAVNARDRIGHGPWYNANAELIAADPDALHGDGNRLSPDTALTETGDPVNSDAAPAGANDILTGSRPDGTAFSGPDDLTCSNWTSSSLGRAQTGRADRAGDRGATSWNSEHATSGCSPNDLQQAGGTGRFYCFAID